MSSTRKRSYGDYSIGWISALPLELSAAIAMLDDHHDDLPPGPGDDNVYVLGRIHQHNVAIAALPSGEFGTNSAAQVAVHMQRTFHSMKFCLLVGIGGGVPSRKHDVRLGDIVVSTPNSERNGVIQYDLFRNKPTGFVNFGYLNSPPRALRSAISAVRAWHAIPGQNKIQNYLSPGINPKLPWNFTRPKEPDYLFRSDYIHVNDTETCLGHCDVEKLMPRDSRNSLEPVIHYGTIASGNQIMQNGIMRDELAKQHNILCFEMEAAGLMNTFPCIVIRGISDYSDSHKNQTWKPYAAATAAAYAKELLRFLPNEQVDNTVCMQSGLADTHSNTPCNISVLAAGSLNWDEVGLGRLVLNISNPAEEYYCHSTITVTPDQCSIDPFYDIKGVIKQQKKSPFAQTFLDFLFQSVAMTPTPDEDTIASRSVTYKLLNFGSYFKRLINDEETKRWIERIGRSSNVYLVVAIHILTNESDPTRFASHDLRPGDRIIGVQYRRIRLRSFNSSKVDAAQLEKVSLWKMYDLKARRSGDDDSLAAELATTSLDELEDEYEFDMYCSADLDTKYVLFVYAFLGFANMTEGR